MCNEGPVPNGIGDTGKSTDKHVLRVGIGDMETRRQTVGTLFPILSCRISIFLSMASAIKAQKLCSSNFSLILLPLTPPFPQRKNSGAKNCAFL